MTDQTKIKRDEPAAVFTHEPAAEVTPWALTEKRIPLFSYDDAEGNSVTVTMPDRPNPGLALEFLRKARRIGAELAISWLVEEAITEDGYDTLVSELGQMPDPENGARIMQQIGQKVQTVVMGGLDGPKA